MNNFNLMEDVLIGATFALSAATGFEVLKTFSTLAL
jgi:hypothetical protein